MNDKTDKNNKVYFYKLETKERTYQSNGLELFYTLWLVDRGTDTEQGRRHSTDYIKVRFQVMLF